MLQIGGLIAFLVGVTTQEEHHAPIYEGDPDDPRTLRVELDGGPIEGGVHVGLTIRHL